MDITNWVADTMTDRNTADQWYPLSEIDDYNRPLWVIYKNANKIQALLNQRYVTNDGRSFIVNDSHLCQLCGKWTRHSNCADCQELPIQPHGYMIVTDDKLTSKFMKVFGDKGHFLMDCHYLTTEEFLKMTNKIFDENTDI